MSSQTGRGSNLESSGDWDDYVDSGSEIVMCHSPYEETPGEGLAQSEETPLGSPRTIPAGIVGGSITTSAALPNLPAGGEEDAPIEPEVHLSGVVDNMASAAIILPEAVISFPETGASSFPDAVVEAVTVTVLAPAAEVPIVPVTEGGMDSAGATVASSMSAYVPGHHLPLQPSPEVPSPPSGPVAGHLSVPSSSPLSVPSDIESRGSSMPAEGSQFGATLSELDAILQEKGSSGPAMASQGCSDVPTSEAADQEVLGISWPVVPPRRTRPANDDSAAMLSVMQNSLAQQPIIPLDEARETLQLLTASYHVLGYPAEPWMEAMTVAWEKLVQQHREEEQKRRWEKEVLPQIIQLEVDAEELKKEAAGCFDRATIASESSEEAAEQATDSELRIAGRNREMQQLRQELQRLRQELLRLGTENEADRAESLLSRHLALSWIQDAEEQRARGEALRRDATSLEVQAAELRQSRPGGAPAEM